MGSVPRAELIRQQKLTTGVDFYGFALQGVDDTTVGFLTRPPLPLAALEDIDQS